MDEAGIKKNEAIEYGWAKKGERLQDLRNGSKAKSVNIIASLSEKKIVAPFIFEGNCNSEIFRMYLYDVLKPYLRKNNVLILDNASFHKHSVVMKFSEEVGCKAAIPGQKLPIDRQGFQAI